MRTIENKEMSLMLTETEKLTYCKLLLVILNKPLKQGITMREMKRDLDIVNKLENKEVGDLVEFSDEEIHAIKTAVETHEWYMVNPELVQFGTYIELI